MKILTVGHSHVVAQNRRLAHEIAKAACGRWEVTVGAPERLPGELREITLHVAGDELCPVCVLGMRLASSPHLRHFDRRLRALMAHPWDVVHVWQEPYVAAGAQVASWAPRAAQVVVTSFQNIPKKYPAPFSWCERVTMERANAWIAFGRTAHEALNARLGYASKPSRVIPPGVDVGSFRPDPAARAAVRRRLGWTDTDLVVGFLGRFVPEKGMETLLDALPRTGGGWKALFVGGGPLEPLVLRFASANPGRVAVIPAVDHDDVPAHLNAMDLLCAPSRTTTRWREQFGRMLIEAMACGVPVAASRSGEIPYVVDGAGILVDEADVPAWTRTIERLLADEETRREYRDRGLTRVHERFTWGVVARAHLAFFEELL